MGTFAVESCPGCRIVDIKLHLAILQFFFQEGSVVNPVIICFRVDLYLVPFVKSNRLSKSRTFRYEAFDFFYLTIELIHIIYEGHVVQIAPDVLAAFEDILLGIVEDGVVVIVVG